MSDPDAQLTIDQPEDVGVAKAPSIPAHDMMGQARVQGYSWGDINAYIADRQQEATRGGWSPDEALQHLGYQDSTPLQDRLDFTARANTALGDEADHPVLRASRGVIDPADSENLVPGGAADINLRASYSDALLTGQVKGPDDFSRFYASSVGHPDAALQLAEQLPSNEDLTDYAIGIANQAHVPPTPEQLATIKQNMMSLWTTDQLNPGTVFNRAMGDANARDEILQPYDKQLPDPGSINGMGRRVTIGPQLAAEFVVKAAVKIAGSFWDAISIPEAVQAGRVPHEDLEQLARDYAPMLAHIRGNVPGGIRPLEGEVLPPLPKEMLPPGGPEPKEPITIDNEVFTPLKELLNFAVEKAPRDNLPAVVPGREPVEAPAIMTMEPAFPDVNGTIRRFLSDDSGAFKMQGISKVVASDLAREDLSGEALQAFFDRRQGLDGGKYTVMQYRNNANRENAVARVGMDAFAKAVQEYVPEFDAELNRGGVHTTRSDPATGEHQQLSVIRSAWEHLDGRSDLPGVIPFEKLPEPVQGAINAVKGIYQESRLRGEAAIERGVIPKHGWIDDYHNHWYEQNEVSRQYLQGQVSGREGSTRAFIARTIPYAGDAFDKGLKPKFPNFVEGALAYKRMTDDALATAEMRKLGMDMGQVVRSATAPGPGWTKLKGRSSVQMFKTEDGREITGYLWGRDGWAKAYNSNVGRGIYDWEPWTIGSKSIEPGRVYDKFTTASNKLTALKFGLAAYHVQNIAVEAINAGMSQAFGELAHGELTNFLHDMGASALVFPRLAETAMRGRQAQLAYLKQGNFPAHVEQIIQVMTDAGAQFGGRVRIREATGARDFQSVEPGVMQNFVDAYKNGVLWSDQKAQLGRLVGSKHVVTNLALAVPRILSIIGNEAVAGLNTLNKPFFDHFIPYVKNAANFEATRLYIEAHPNISYQELVMAVHKIIKNTDDWMGEWNYDNLFMNRTAKQLFAAPFMAPMWAVGTIRGVSSGTVGLGQAFVNAARGEGVEVPIATRRLFTQPIAIGITAAMVAWAAQVALTGGQDTTKYPGRGRGGVFSGEGLKDMFVGPVINGIRFLMPGALQKEVFSIWSNFKENGGLGFASYGAAKLVSLLNAPLLAAANRQWWGGPKIIGMTAPDWKITKGLDGIISQFIDGDRGTWTGLARDYMHFMENQVNTIMFSGNKSPDKQGWPAAIAGWQENPFQRLITPEGHTTKESGGMSPGGGGVYYPPSGNSPAPSGRPKETTRSTDRPDRIRRKP